MNAVFDRANLRSVCQPQFRISSAKRKITRRRTWDDEVPLHICRNLVEVLRESLKTEMRRAFGQIAFGIQFDDEFLVSREVSVFSAIDDKVFVPTAIHVSSALDIVSNY